MTAGLGTRTGETESEHAPALLALATLWQRKQLSSLAPLDSAKRLTLSSGTTILLINGPKFFLIAIAILSLLWRCDQASRRCVQPRFPSLNNKKSIRLDATEIRICGRELLPDQRLDFE